MHVHCERTISFGQSKLLPPLTRLSLTKYIAHFSLVTPSCSVPCLWFRLVVTKETAAQIQMNLPLGTKQCSHSDTWILIPNTPHHFLSIKWVQFLWGLAWSWHQRRFLGHHPKWGWGGDNRKRSYQVHLPGILTGKNVTQKRTPFPNRHVVQRLLVTWPSFHPLHSTHKKPRKLLKLKTGRRATEGVGEKVGPSQPTSPQCVILSKTFVFCMVGE